MNSRILHLITFFLVCFIFSVLTVSAQPPNDNLANAIEITSVPFTSPSFTEAEMEAATNETNESICGTAPRTSWYYFTPLSDGNLTLTAADFDGPYASFVIALYTGMNHPLNLEGACSFSGGGPNGGNSTALSVTSGTTYYVQVSSSNSASTIATGAVVELQVTGDNIIGTGGNVPTLSEWALIILALMLMTAGTLYLVQPNFREGLNRNS